MAEEVHWAEAMYAMLVRMGVSPQDWVINYDPEDSDARVVLALPETKIALAVEGDDPEPLIEQGWTVERLSIATLQVFGKVYRSLQAAGFEHTRRLSEQRMVKTGSQDEERLLAAILRANIKEPDRNYRISREDGSELTTPDFAWPDLKIAFFMDGLWWHVGRDDEEKMEELREIVGDDSRAASMMETNRSRAERDADNRSELAVMGWRILACTDRDLETDEGVRRQVERISKMMRAVIAERHDTTAFKPAPTVASVDTEDLADLV